MGRREFGHDYVGAEVRGDTVCLHGVARGTLTLAKGGDQRLANNFIIVMKPDDDGTLKAWRVAFAAGGSLAG